MSGDELETERHGKKSTKHRNGVRVEEEEEDERKREREK